MNLKYYLRGLGLGILVTALILGLAGGKEKMSDAQIKARALELGMIENTVLTEDKAEDTEKVEEPEEPAVSEEIPAVEEKEEEVVPEPVEEVVEEKADAVDEAVEPVVEETKKDEGTESGTEGDSGATDSQKTDDASQSEPAGDKQEVEPQVVEESVAPVAGRQAVVLTIVSGDSSYTVAKKLADLGVVESVVDYDKYLCQNGYDKSIRTGTYEIPVEMTLEQIAKMINGR